MGHLNSLSVQLAPHLVCTVRLHVGLPDPMSLRHQTVITSGSKRCKADNGVDAGWAK